MRPCGEATSAIEARPRSGRACRRGKRPFASFIRFRSIARDRRTRARPTCAIAHDVRIELRRLRRVADRGPGDLRRRLEVAALATSWYCHDPAWQVRPSGAARRRQRPPYLPGRGRTQRARRRTSLRGRRLPWRAPSRPRRRRLHRSSGARPSRGRPSSRARREGCATLRFTPARAPAVLMVGSVSGLSRGSDRTVPSGRALGFST